ncbi:MAG: hypothetical protein H6592_08595 [Flavobacteriales bacterium]|nr:hypothetical protein [Flavobacteriales bacterium]
MKYLDTIAERQIELDRLVETYAAAVVGNGYIDIIVPRERYMDFFEELTKSGFAVEAVSWWCHATEENKRSLGCPHGYGGPMTSIGWFSELSHDFDEATDEDTQRLDGVDIRSEVRRLNDRMIAIIQNKEILKMANGRSLKFSADGCLTPGIWVRVPENWMRERA